MNESTLTNRHLRNFRRELRIATLSGQQIASLVINLHTVFF